MPPSSSSSLSNPTTPSSTSFMYPLPLTSSAARAQITTPLIRGPLPPSLIRLTRPRVRRRCSQSPSSPSQLHPQKAVVCWNSSRQVQIEGSSELGVLESLDGEDMVVAIGGEGKGINEGGGGGGLWGGSGTREGGGGLWSWKERRRRVAWVVVVVFVAVAVVVVVVVVVIPSPPPSSFFSSSFLSFSSTSVILRKKEKDKLVI